MMERRIAGACVLTLAVIAAGAVPAFADNKSAGSVKPSAGTLTKPSSRTEHPPLYKLSALQAERIAERDQKVRDYLGRYKRHTKTAYTKGPGRWQVSYYSGGNEIAQVVVDDSLGVAVEAWTGPQVAWTMARGIKGAFGRKVTEPWLWVSLMVLFVLPFFNPRRPFQLLHLDLLVMLSFSVSHYFFNKGEILTSAPLVYPALLYLLLRMLLAGFVRRFRCRPQPLRLLIPLSWLTLLLVFMVGFRVGLNVIDSNVIDVGYAGVIGADRLTTGKELYGHFPKDNQHGDTYGPVNYYAYVPFELALPWHGGWDDLPAAHAAAIVFDLATLLGLFLVGYRWQRGPPSRNKALGLALAYGWAAYPYTLFVSNSNANDSLVAMLLVYGFLLLRSPAGRGAVLALASATKFAAGALAPLWVSYSGSNDRHRNARERRRVWRSRLLFCSAFAATLAIAMLPAILGPGLPKFWDRTLGFQLSRQSPFSIWGLHPVRYGWLQDVVKYGAAALALLVAFVPRRKDPLQLAALTAAVLIALQLAATHWFYLYIVWFFPFVMVVLLAQFEGGSGVYAGLKSGDGGVEIPSERLPDGPHQRLN